MARRTRKKKSKSTNAIPMIIGALCVVAVLAGGIFILSRGKSSRATPLDAETYTNSPESLRGSTFAVRAEVIKKIYYKEGVTQVVQIVYNNEQIPIEIPHNVKGPNINAQQEYTFIVKAKNDAWLVAKSYTDK